MKVSQVVLKRRAAAAAADAKFAAEEAAARSALSGADPGADKTVGGPPSPSPAAALDQGLAALSPATPPQEGDGDWDGAGLPVYETGASTRSRGRTHYYVPREDKRARFTKERARKICDLIAAGHNVREICKRSDMPSTITVYTWIRSNPVFKKDYTFARKVARERLEEEMLEIIDDTSKDVLTLLNEDGMYYKVLNPVAVQRAKARVAVRAKMIEWHMPKKHYPEADEAAAASAAEAAASANGNGGHLQYRLTEERRLALIERRRIAIVSGAHKEERERYLREAAEAELAKRRASGDAGSNQER